MCIPLLKLPFFHELNNWISSNKSIALQSTMAALRTNRNKIILRGGTGVNRPSELALMTVKWCGLVPHIAGCCRVNYANDIWLQIVLPQRNYRLGRLEYPIGAFRGNRGRFDIGRVKLHLGAEHKAQPLLSSNTKVYARTSFDEWRDCVSSCS